MYNNYRNQKFNITGENKVSRINFSNFSINVDIEPKSIFKISSLNLSINPLILPIWMSHQELLTN
ncbi:hypothetical protein BpHYR1_016131 [Brachionus plicatilis]|uniref:Uncharacterized protein n=1 Tax=Brachionus plicatilis TaxID=10195 RepID=A0A3M7QR51_BRAPC|nr:hypothetical protein BpHYR1_016131 [Brachionus plicatilis]